MEALGIAANAIAVIDLSFKVISLLAEYSQDVKDARVDIGRIRQEVDNLDVACKGVNDLLEGPDGARLKTSRQLLSAVGDSQTRIEELYSQLRPKSARQAMSRLGMRALKWPFEKKQVDRIVQHLFQCTQAISVALQVDQTAILLGLEHKTVLSRLEHDVATGASYNSHAEEHNPTCLPNTRVKLLDEILEWADDPGGKPIFWLNGMAGTGKSTISRTVARLLASKNRFGASFFFKAGETDREGLAKFFTTIVADLIVQEPAIAGHVQEALDANPAILRTATVQQFDELILEPLSKVPQKLRKADPAIIIIDALDECNSEQDIRLLINLFSERQTRGSESKTRIFSDARIRVFLTSRPELPIRIGFTRIKGTYKDLVLHEMPEEVVEHDIRAYLEHELSSIRKQYNLSVSGQRQLDNEWPVEAEIRSLVRMAVPLFIFAATVCRFVADRRYGSPDRQLKEILQFRETHDASQMEATYMPVLNRLVAGLSGKRRDKILAEFRLIVGSIILLGRPLSTSSLAKLLDVDNDVIDAIMDFLHSVMSIPSSGGPVRLLHLSFRDFLLDLGEDDTQGFGINAKRAHGILAANCIRVMQSLHQDICQLEHPGIDRKGVKPTQINRHIRSSLAYACLHWVNHARDAEDYAPDCETVYGFLTVHFLHWVEVLSFQERVWEVEGIIGTLQSIEMYQSDESLSNFLQDASRFVVSNISTIDDTPLQLYSSLLIFAPESSIVKRLFKSAVPSWISLQPFAETQWGQRVRTFNGSGGSIALSSDAKLLATISQRDIHIWDVATGKSSKVLRGDKETNIGILWVAFSQDSQLLVSTSGRSILIWKIETGECIASLASGNGPINTFCFSSDSRFIVSGADDRTIRIWLAATYECLVTLEGHTAGVTSIALSRDSKLLVSGSRDRSVRIWSLDLEQRTGECIRVLQGHSYIVNSVALSHDSALVVSGSDDDILRVWDANTGDCLHEETTGTPLLSVAFSHDSTLIAAGLWGATGIWNVSSRSWVEFLRERNGFIFSAIFSHDSKLVATSSESGARVWTLNKLDTAPTLEDSVGLITSITISPDSDLIATGLKSGRVQIWHPRTREVMQTFSGHTKPVRAVAFSHDAQLVASAANKESMRIWNIESGACLHSIEISDWTFITTMTFGYDLKSVGLGHNYGVVGVWSLEFEKCSIELSDDKFYDVQSVAYSPDSELIAASSGSNALRVWLVETGQCVLRFSDQPHQVKFELGNDHIIKEGRSFPIQRHIPTEYKPDVIQSKIESSDVKGIQILSSWVKWDGKPLLWLPEEYVGQGQAVQNSTIAIGHRSTRVAIIKFCEDDLPPVYRQKT